MTPEAVKRMVETEREALLSIKGKMGSPYFKDQCQSALNYLGDAEQNADSPDIVAAALLTYRFHRKIVDDAVNKWGYNAASSYDPPRS
jgi:hypothetical protein